MSNSPYILGGVQTDFSRNWTKEGKTFMSMFREVVEDGLAAAGMDYAEIKRLNKENRIAIYVGNFDAEQYANNMKFVEDGGSVTYKLPDPVNPDQAQALMEKGFQVIGVLF